MKLTREAIQRMISQKQGTSNVTVINQEGGGGGGGVTLGPLLTSLNAEAMPTAEGYLHWTGSAWAFDTPTGGDPVDLTPYALKTWVQTNYASKDDIADFITESQAEDLFAAIDHTHANYLPLSAGPNKALTGSLYFSGNSGINWAGGVGMLACTPESGWTGISSSQWGVGALSAQGVIRSNANDLLHYRNGANYKIWDAYNFTPSDYLPLTGGTVESLTVTNGLDADSITVGSIVNSDTLAEYLDADAMQTWGDGRYLKLTDKAGLFTQLANYDGALQITIGGTQKSLTIAYANASGSANTAVNADKLDNHHASDFALASALGNYLPLTGGTVAGTLNVRTQLNIQSAAGANKISIDGTTPNIDIASGGSLTFDVDSHIAHDATNDRLVIHGYNGLLIDSDTYVGTVDGGNQVATRNFVGSQLELFETYVWQQANNRYLKLIGGTVNGNLNVKGTIQAQDSNGNNKVIIYGSSGNIRSEKVYIGGSTSGYEAATHNWVTSQGYQANVIETVKVAGTALTPTNKAVDIPAATSDGSTFGVVAIGTGFTFDEDRLCVDTSTFATRTWADGRYLPLTAGSSKPLTDTLYIANNKGLYIKDTDGTGRMAVFMNNLNQFFVGFGMRQGGYEGYFDSNIIYLRTGSTGTTMTLDASRNVGIGTTSPAYKLDVSGVIKATEGVMVRDANGNRVGLGIDGLLMMYPSSGSSASAYVMSFEYDASGSWPMVKTKFSARPQVITGQSGSTYTYTNVALTSDLSGYATQQWVGQQGYITQTTADGRYLPLTAGSSKPLTGDLYLSEDLVLNNEKYIYFKNHSGTLCDALSHSYNEEDGIDTLYLGFDFRKSSHSTEIYGNKLTLLTGASARERLVITSGGNVGIGTTSPAYKLDVSGVVRATEGMMVRNGSSDAIGFDTTGVFFNKAQEGGSPIPASIFAFTWDNDAQNVIVSKNGNMTVTGKLAVGTTAFDGSNAKLQVGGNMFATGSITSKSNAGSVTLGNGNISATNLYISTVVFGTSNNDPAIYIGNGHVYARNSQGQTTMIV